MNHILIFTLLLVFGGPAEVSDNKTGAQINEKPSLYLPFYGKDAGCENNRYKFEYLRNFASHEAAQGRKLILVVRLGNSERSQNLLYRRIYNLKRATEKHPNVLVASGDKTPSDGKVEVYIAGRLEDEIIIEKNKDICMTCCDGESEYYPDIDRRTRQRR